MFKATLWVNYCFLRAFFNRRKEDPLLVDALGNRRSSKWPALRKKHLEIDPECHVCGTVEDLEVHHIFPVGLWPELELTENNLMTLCRDHHFLMHGCDWSAWIPHARELAAKLRHEVRYRRYKRDASG